MKKPATKKVRSTKELSNCCRVPVATATSDEGTSSYYCPMKLNGCGRSCDVLPKKPVKPTYTTFCGADCCKGHDSEVEPVFNGQATFTSWSFGPKTDRECITDLQGEVWALRARQTLTILAVALLVVLVGLLRVI